MAKREVHCTVGYCLPVPFSTRVCVCVCVCVCLHSVEVHDSYQFVSKSYHSMQYYFRSIDTWLKGVCKR